MNFSKQKNGFNENEVNQYITSLNLEHQKELKEKDIEIAKLKAKLDGMSSKENSIAFALTAAVDKAKEIEESSQNIYKLKLEQLSMLYSKWEIFLNEMLKKYPEIDEIENLKEKLIGLKTSIRIALKDDFNIDLMSKTPATDPIRNLLNRLTEKKQDVASVPKKKEIKRKTNVSASQKTDLNKIEERANLIKPISNIKLNKDEAFENIVDKFLCSEDDIPNSFKKVLNVPDYSQGDGKFDLNEAINPKEDLKEIMKSFDFFDENN